MRSLREGGLHDDGARELHQHGFVVLPNLVPAWRAECLAQAYDTAVASASADDVRTGRTTTRVPDFVNRGAEFDDVYVSAPLLEACSSIIGRSFKLSSLHARTLWPGHEAQELHADVRRDSADWPLVGFILMVDEFRPDNGATRFVPGSHCWSEAPEDVMADLSADYEGQVLACGPAGSLLIFTAPRGTATPPTRRIARAARSRVRSSQGAGAPRPAGRPGCAPRRAHASVQSRGMCSAFDGCTPVQQCGRSCTSCGMTTENAATFAAEWAEAWNRRDIEHVLAHFHEDVEFTSPTALAVMGVMTVRGKTALREVLGDRPQAADVPALHGGWCGMGRIKPRARHHLHGGDRREVQARLGEPSIQRSGPRRGRRGVSRNRLVTTQEVAHVLDLAAWWQTA